MALKGNKYIDGVNWASLKKFAKFFFNTSYRMDNIIEANGVLYYKIYIDKVIYWENIDEVRRFENEFSKKSNLEIIPIE